MPFRDLLKKKEHNEEASTGTNAPAEFKFVRSDTYAEEQIEPPSGGPPPSSKDGASSHRKSFGRFRSSSRDLSRENSPGGESRRLSERLHFSRDKTRPSSASSANIPQNLPDLSETYKSPGDEDARELQWEQRATMLASYSPNTAAERPPTADMAHLSLGEQGGRSRRLSDAATDAEIQKAIVLHESGDEQQLREATVLFGKLADQGNILSQLLYGLSLCHGWGCPPDKDRAFHYLSISVSNAAALEAESLKQGSLKGGPAKGELTMGMYELANCWRYGYGTKVDPAAARQYYETAANLGDVDGMEQAAWCYMEGFGGKKDKFKAAQLLRLAEKKGGKQVGTSWIWKEKYDPK